MNPKSSLLATLLATMMCLTSANAQTRQLTVASWGGSYQAAQRTAHFEPFTKSAGVAVAEDQHNGDIAKVKAMVQAKAVTWDVVNMYKFSVIQGCDDGILEPLDAAAFGDPKDFLPGAIHRCGIASDIFANIIAFDKGRVGANAPQTLADFFNVEKWPGKRGLKRAPQGNLEMALMADGVAPKDVYALLATVPGQDRAFNMLNKIKGRAVWWQAGAQPPQLLADGEVVMTTAYNGRIYNANETDKRNFGIVWDGQVYEFDYWAIPKGTPRLDLAKQFLAFALSPQKQADQTRFIPYGPSRASAEPLVAQNIKQHLPTEQAKSGRALPASPEFWAENFDTINQRFQAWLAR